jgi:hypothetical protein
MRTIPSLIFAILLVGCSRTPSAQDVLGVPLPATAQDVRVASKDGFSGGDSYLSASISRQDYMTLVQQLGLRHRADLLDYWPLALTAHETPWWTVTQTNDLDTLFGEQPSIYFVARYEGGRLYFKRHVY